MPHPQSNSDDPLDPQIDPRDWPAFRDQGHRMLDDMFDYLERIRERPVWQPMPDAVRASFRDRLPMAPAELSAVHEEFLENILPYSNGNVHPGFMGWVHGGGNCGRHAGGDAGGRAEREPGRAGSRAHRSGAPDRAMDARTVRISRDGFGLVCHRDFDGEPDRRSGRPRYGARVSMSGGRALPRIPNG